MNTSLLKSAIAGLALSFTASAANATLLFSDISLTSNSMTFTVNGDMTGYVPDPGTYLYQMSISYSGDFWLGAPGSYAPNNWSTSLFDNVGIGYSGNTGWFSGAVTPYSWVNFAGNLTSAFAIDRVVTLSFAENYFDPGASGTIDFLWGNGYTTSTKTSLAAVSADPIPSPSSGILLTLALAMAGLLALWRKPEVLVAEFKL